MMSGARARPRVGVPSGRASSAAVPEGSSMRMGADSTATARRRGAARSAVAVEDAGLGQAGEALLDGPGPGVAHALDLVEVVDGGPQDLLQAGEAIDDVVNDGL